MKILSTLVFASFAVALGFSAFGVASVPEERKKEAVLVAAVQFKSQEATFEGAVVLAQVWEHDPRIADRGAKKFAEVTIKKVAHTKGKTSTLSIALGERVNIRPDRRY